MNILDYAILLFSCVVEIYICKDFITSFYEKREYNRRYNALLLDCACIMLLYLINLIGNANLNLILVPIVLIVYMRFACRMNLLQVAMCFIIVFSALFGGELIFVVLAEVTNLDSGLNLSEMPWLTFGAKLVSYMILVIIMQTSNKSQKRLQNNIFWMYLLLPAASIGMMLTTFFAAENAIDSFVVKCALSASFFLMLVGNMIVFKAFNKYGETLHMNMEQSLLLSRERMNKEHFLKVERMNEERQTLMHDLKQYVRTANLLLHQEEYTEAKELLDVLGEKISDNEKHIYCKNPQIDAALSDRVNHAKANDICFEVNVEPLIDFDKINTTDYIVMLGNLLDNAMQAVEKCLEKKEIIVNFFISENGAFLVCKIRNTFNPEFIKVESGEFVSTKSEKGVHGLGIKSVKNMANQNGGHLVSKIEESYFVSILVIPI